MPLHRPPSNVRSARAHYLFALVRLAFSLALSAPALIAQSPVDGILQGRIVGSRGSPLPHTVLRISRDGSSWTDHVTSSRDGSFVLLGLPPGDYTVQAELFGQPLPCVTADAAVEPGENSIVTLTVDPEKIASCPRSPQTSPTAGLPSATPGIRAGDLLALSGEDLTQLDSAAHDATLASAPATDTSEDEPAAPAAQREASELGAPSAGPSINALSPTQNSQLLDGLSTTQSFRAGPRGSAAGGPRTSSTFGVGAVRSFQVLPRTFSAQYSGAAGGVIAVTSRGLAERLHGTAFLRTRQSALAATNPYAVVTHFHDGIVTSGLLKPSDRNLQLGGSVGLPLSHLPFSWLQLASLFGSLEAQLRNGQLASSPASATFFRLTGEQLALLGNRGVTGASANAALNFLDSLTGIQDRSSTRSLGFGRLDLAPTPRQHITLGYIRNRFNSPTGSGSGPADGVISRGRASLADSVVHIDAFTARWAYRLSPRSTTELRGQLARDLDFESPHTPLPQEPAISVGGLAPQVTIAPNGFSFGTPSSLGRIAYPDEHRIQLADDWTLARGRHVFTLGMDWSRLHDRIAAAPNAEGTFLYDSGTANGRDGGLVDWITDYTFNVHAYPNGACPSIHATVHLFCFRSYTQGFVASETRFATHEIAGYAQDALRLPHGLSLALGARYDYILLPPPQAPNPALNAVVSSIPGPLSGSTSVIPEDRNNLGPRLSLAWSPGSSRSFTLRLGYGAFFGRVPGATVQHALADTALASTTRRIRITPSTETLCPQVANQGFGYPCAYTAAPPSAVAQTTSAVLFARSFRLPAVQRATFTVERAGRHFQIRTGYAMALATQLPQSVDLNIAPSTSLASFVLQGGDRLPGLRTGRSFSIPLYTQRRSTAFGPITALVSHANATFHSFNAETRIQLAGFQLRGSYTFARAIDYGPQLSATPRTNGQFDPFTDGYDKALASLDVRHRFSGDLLLRSSVRRGPELFRATLSGWRLATIATASSGAPYGYTIFGGTNLSGGRDSINGSGGAAYLPTVGRNTLRLPPRAHIDLRASRDIRLHRDTRLEAFVESFNLFNARNLSRIETRAFLLGTPASAGQPTPLIFQDPATVAAEGLSTPAFGTPTSSTSGLSRERQIELGLRLNF
ncbi:MAG TPA: carboxypeptidase regulatory-like domain-containing protein [Acidobacteriaceae bacterium]|nr:carboxypeptidase regulatory-like domain-containing protein [Acidobacteriaceae bacterium]